MPRVPKRHLSAQPEDATVPSIPGDLIPAPAELCPDEAREWDKIFADAPADFYPRTTYPMIVQLCRHICQSRFHGECLQEVRAGLLDPRDAEDCEHLDRLTRLHDREGRAISAIMDKLRMTVRASTTAAKTEEARAKAPPAEAKTWQHDVDVDVVMPWKTHQ